MSSKQVSIDLSGRTAVITGASGGIGQALARRFKKAGARVISWSRRPSGTADLDVEVDITDAAAVDRATAQSLEAHGRIDIVINNAGILGPVAPAWEIEPDAFRSVLDVNLTGAFLVCRALLPHMRRQKADPLKGWIVNVASALAKEATAQTSAYAASKAGLIAMTRSIAREVAADDIAVNAVTPTVVDAGMADAYDDDRRAFLLNAIPKGRFGTGDELADMILWLSSDACSFTTGAVFDLSGGKSSS